MWMTNTPDISDIRASQKIKRYRDYFKRQMLQCYKRPKRYTSSYDHDIWPAKILERSDLAVKSYHPETLAAEEYIKKIK